MRTMQTKEVQSHRPKIENSSATTQVFYTQTKKHVPSS